MEEKEGWDREADYSSWSTAPATYNDSWAASSGWGPGQDMWELDPVENEGWGPAPPAIPEDHVPAEIPDLSAFAKLDACLEWEDLEKLRQEEWLWEGIREGDQITGRSMGDAFHEYLQDRERTEIEESYVPER